jgi:Mn2+/Fe2+ NRAMP family transporter
LALPVLAGSAAYALGEAMGWSVGLAKRAGRAPAFYAAIAVATVIGAALNFSPIDPIRALFWSAVVNGIVAVPVMVLMMLMTHREDVMAEFVLPPVLKVVGRSPRPLWGHRHRARRYRALESVASLLEAMLNKTRA